MKKCIKFIASILLVVVSFGCVACNNTKNSAINDVEEIFKPTEEETVKTTETALLRNGISPYRIVVPDNASSDVKFAAEELQYFFSLPTGITLPIIPDSYVGEDTKGKYLSVGATSIARAAGLSSDYNTLGSDGYRIKTHGNAVAMLGGRDTGTIYSVYGYMYKQFKLKIYAADLFTYETVTDAKLVDLNWTDIPDIAHRTASNYFTPSWSPWQLDSDAARLQRSRYRMTNFWGEPYGMLSHTHFTILPPEIYYKDHPDWYFVPPGAANNTVMWQLDMSNQEMWPEFLERAKILIEEAYSNNPDCNFYQFGVEDNGNEPDNQRYTDLKAQLGGVASGVQLYFLNYIVQHLNVWTEEKWPGAYFEYSFFAYGGTYMPCPVKNVGTKDAPVYETYQYTDPYDGKVKELKPVDNLVPMITPIMQHRSHGYLDDTNPGSKEAFEAWGSISKKMHVWSYNAYFEDFMAPFNSWSSYKQNYMDYKRLGVNFVFEQGMCVKTPNFLELQAYLMSQLMWDTTLDTETLIMEFMQVYYGPGWEEVYEYLSLMRARLHEMETLETAGYKYAYINPNLGLNYPNRSNWFPVSFLMKCEEILARGLAKTEPGSMYYKHVEYARMPQRYLLLSLAYNYYEPSVYREMVYDFERVLVDYGAAPYYTDVAAMPYSALIESWLAKVA